MSEAFIGQVVNVYQVIPGYLLESVDSLLATTQDGIGNQRHFQAATMSVSFGTFTREYTFIYSNISSFRYYVKRNGGFYGGIRKYSLREYKWVEKVQVVGTVDLARDEEVNYRRRSQEWEKVFNDAVQLCGVPKKWVQAAEYGHGDNKRRYLPLSLAPCE